MTTENDIVLIYFEDMPFLFARIEKITPDVKPDWLQVKLLLLRVPPQPVTWILKEEYVNGDIFFMNGKKMKLEKVVCPEDEEFKDPTFNEKKADKPKKDNDSKVISFTDLKKK